MRRKPESVKRKIKKKIHVGLTDICKGPYLLVWRKKCLMITAWNLSASPALDVKD